ncbi:protein FAR1-RELATED SEQUENCE 5-like [Silene latifolia]|uniref:protein FAR1-RELATED SEQUENCE 5-like n=1 Tax=Silene latifolia TaxID=37657 RepID=UPI003D777D20
MQQSEIPISCDNSIFVVNVEILWANEEERSNNDNSSILSNTCSNVIANEGAIVELNTAQSALAVEVDVPELGIEFYGSYAKECGFVTRLGSQKVSKGVVTHKKYLCDKAGECEAKGTQQRRQRTRIGCPALIKFRRIDEGQYEIYDFDEGHNHMPQTPLTMVHLTQSRELNIIHKKMIVDNSKLNLGPVKSFKIFKEYVIGYKNVGASLEDFKKISRDIKKYFSEGDAQMVIEHFMKFLDAIEGRHPVCLITDEDAEIEEGMKLVWKDKVKHRYCMWHILKKMPEKVGPSICKETEFLKEINSCVWGEVVEPHEFEESWTRIVEFHGLSENEWLKEKYGIRQMWIPAYFRDLFLGGLMRITSRVVDSPVYCDELLGILREFKERVTNVPDENGNSGIAKEKDKNAKIGMLLGISIPSEIMVLPPRQCKNKGSGKRLISQRERVAEVNKKPLIKCRACGEMANHDSRNCD